MGDSPHDSVSLLRIHDPSFPTSRTNQHRRLGNNDPRLIYIYIYISIFYQHLQRGHQWKPLHHNQGPPARTPLQGPGSDMRSTPQRRAPRARPWPSCTRASTARPFGSSAPRRSAERSLRRPPGVGAAKRGGGGAGWEQRSGHSIGLAFILGSLSHFPKHFGGDFTGGIFVALRLGRDLELMDRPIELLKTWDSQKCAFVQRLVAQMRMGHKHNQSHS